MGAMARARWTWNCPGSSLIALLLSRNDTFTFPQNPLSSMSAGEESWAALPSDLGQPHLYLPYACA